MSLATFFYRTTDNARLLVGLVLLALAIVISSTSSFANESKLKVVTSIKPVHSLVASVMQGVGKPKLLLTGTSTPHGFSLKPSQSIILQNADLIFWIGPSLETSLKKPIGTIGAGAVSIEFEHVSEESGNKANEEEHHDDEHSHNSNAHLWLNPENAILMVRSIAIALSDADPKNADVFDQNALSTISKINDLNKRLEATLEPINKSGYILFHDAYRAFEQRFGFRSAGIISINPEARLSAARIRELQQTVIQHRVSCVFSEPQFNPKTTALIVEGSKAKIGVLDPLGSIIEDGPDLYFTLMKNIANNFAMCLNNQD